MNNIQAQYIIPQELLEKFVNVDNKFEKRFQSLVTDIEHFIEVNDVSDRVKLNYLALGYALVDYFEDVRRLKSFHGIEHINSEKIVAYTAYWILQRKPIQILVEDKELLYINERFVMAYISDFLSREEKGRILLREEKGLNSFRETLFYFLKYRVANAGMLELAIISFFAGQIYQSDKEDLSAIFDKYYKES